MQTSKFTTKLLAGLAVLCFMVCVALAVQAGNYNNASSLNKYSFWSSVTTLRGANLYQRARVKAFDGGPGSLFVPTYGTNIFTSLRKAGANFVVLSIPGPYRVKPPYKADPDALQLLDDLVKRAEKAGLYVVLAFRTAPGRNENDIMGFLPTPVERLLHKPNHPSQRAFARMWRFVAKRFKSRQSVVGYDLLVEPHTAGEKEKKFRADWRKLAKETIDAIRAVDTETPILVQPSSWSSPDALQVWQMPVGDKLVVSVHQYEPFAYITDENGAGQQPFDFSLTKTAYQKIDDFKAAFPDIPVAVTEFGVKNISMNAGSFLQQQFDLIEAQGDNHAIWIWGEDSDNFDVRADSVFLTVTTNWAKNTMFP